MAFRFMQPKSGVQRIRKNDEESQEILDKLSAYIDSASEEPVRFLVRFWKDQGAVITYAELMKIILAEDVPETVMDDWFKDYSVMLAEKMTPVWKEAIEAGYASNPIFRGMDIKELHTAEQYVREWVTTRTAELVTNCCESQRDAIRYLVAEGINSRMSPDAIGREIRATIGLTKPQAVANVRYYNTIKEQMRKDHPRMKDESIERKTREKAARYAAKQQRDRAKMIAQTEVARAYNEGNDAYVRAAINQGLMPPMDRVWVVANSDACSLCKGLAGTSVDMDSKFTAQYGSKVKRVVSCSVPPLHPRCRCAVKYVESNGKSGIIEARIKAAGIRGEINLNPPIPDVSKLSFDDKHINQEREHNVTETEAKSYIQNALFSTTKWEGRFTNYYSSEGVAFVDNEAHHIKTAFKKEEYDEAATAAMEVLKHEWT